MDVRYEVILIVWFAPAAPWSALLSARRGVGRTLVSRRRNNGASSSYRHLLREVTVDHPVVPTSLVHPKRRDITPQTTRLESSPSPRRKVCHARPSNERSAIQLESRSKLSCWGNPEGILPYNTSEGELDSDSVPECWYADRRAELAERVSRSSSRSRHASRGNKAHEYHGACPAIWSIVARVGALLGLGSDGRKEAHVQGHQCHSCRSAYSERSAHLVRGS